MEPIEREATKGCIDFIANNLQDVSLLYPKLISKFLIDKDDEEDIEDMKKSRLKVKKFIEIMQKKEGGFFALLEILMAENKKFVAKHIYDEYKKLGGTTEVSLDEAEKVLKREGWKASSSAFKFSVRMPTEDSGNNAARETSGGAPAASGLNSGAHFRDVHGGSVTNYISHGNMNVGGASGQQSAPVAKNTLEAAGGQPINDNKDAGPVEEFDASVELEKIINKFDQLPKEKKNKLKKVLPESLKTELDDCRDSLFANIDMQDLVNNHMSTVLSDAAIKKIKNAIDNSNGAYELCESLKKGSILGLLTFLKGLENTRQDHLFASYSTKTFCDELLSILEKA